VAAVAGLALAAVVHVHARPLPGVAAPSAPGGNAALGQQIAAAYGWGSGAQWDCLYALWQRESGWDAYATYPSHDTPPSAPSSSITTAYGIPQALPAQRMASAGPDWQTSPATQIRWGLAYVRSTYGTPCSAWSHETADGWY
jgi:hypothetical protein